MKTQGFYRLLNRDKAPDASMRFALKAVVEKYPYFQVAVFTYLKCLYVADDNNIFASELQRLSVFIADRKALFYYIMNEDYEKFFKRKSKRRELSPDRTAYLLNTFFETTNDGSFNMKPDKKALEQNMTTYDYFSLLDSPESEGEDGFQGESGAAPMKHQGIIDNFINNAEDGDNIKITLGAENTVAIQNNRPENKPDDKEDTLGNMPEDLQDDFFFTETLANIYIKQRKYQKAYEIIKRLNLNFPEKNIYFANQISFLEKLIMNEKQKNNNKDE